jgi:hypothetical protein
MMATIFELPPDVLAQARPVSADGAEQLTAQALERLQLEEGQGSDVEASLQRREGGASTCIACGLGVAGAPGFGSLEEQRLHFRTDWHRYNVKRRVTGLQPVSEEQFAALIDRDDAADVGSLSGSESGGSDAEEDALAPGSTGPQLNFVLPGGPRIVRGICWLVRLAFQGLGCGPASLKPIFIKLQTYVRSMYMVFCWHASCKPCTAPAPTSRPPPPSLLQTGSSARSGAAW